MITLKDAIKLEEIGLIVHKLTRTDDLLEIGIIENEKVYYFEFHCVNENKIEYQRHSRNEIGEEKIFETLKELILSKPKYRLHAVTNSNFFEEEVTHLFSVPLIHLPFEFVNK